MKISHSKIHDLITQAKKAEPLTEKEYRYTTLSREEALALKFLLGEKIIDRVTGKGGEVIGGTRETVTTG